VFFRRAILRDGRRADVGSVPRLRALEQNPQCKGHLAQLTGEGDTSNKIVIFRLQQAGVAERQVGAAVDRQPDGQEPWQESAAVYQRRQREEPQAPEDFRRKRHRAMHLDEHRGQTRALGRIESSQEVRTLHQDQRGHVVERVEKIQRRVHEAEHQHQQGPVPVHVLEQPIQGKGQHQADGAGHQIAGDTHAEQQLVRCDAVDGRRSIAADKQLAGDVHEAQRRDQNDQQIEETGEPGFAAERIHDVTLIHWWRAVARGAVGCQLGISHVHLNFM